MARTGVTYIDIAKAAQVIKSHNQEPTVDRVREHLGTGSKSTIAPLLKRWRSENTGAASPEGLPKELITSVKSLYEQVQSMADQKIEQAQTKFNTASEEQKNKLDEINDTFKQLTSSHDELKQKLKTTEEEKDTVKLTLDELNTRATRTEIERDEFRFRVDELKSTIEELKQENCDVRDHFEHYQQRVAEDRQQEREQSNTTHQNLQGQIRDLRGQLNNSDKQLTELKTEKTQHLELIDNLISENLSLQLRLNKKISNIDRLDEKNGSLVEQNKNIEEQSHILQDKVNSLSKHQTESEKEICLLRQSLEKTEAELKEANNKIFILDNENKIVLQEKSVIQGQFKQLQSSI